MGWVLWSPSQNCGAQVPSTLTSGAPVKITGVPTISQLVSSLSLASAGSSNAGASMNPGGLNAILKDAITKNGLTIGGASGNSPHHQNALYEINYM